jgi:hypothetical protein
MLPLQPPLLLAIGRASDSRVPSLDTLGRAQVSRATQPEKTVDVAV